MGQTYDYPSADVHGVMSGWIALTPDLNKIDRAFSAAILDFQRPEESRNVRMIDFGKRARIYTTSQTDDFSETTSQRSYSVGYAIRHNGETFERVSLSAEISSSASSLVNLTDFIDSRFSAISCNDENIKFYCDYFGKKKFFLKITKDAIFFSNEFRTLTFVNPELDSVNIQSLRNYLTLDSVFGTETISNAIVSIPINHYAVFSCTTKSLSMNRLTPSTNDNNVRVTSFSNIRKSLELPIAAFNKVFNFQYCELSGGADTRVNLAIAQSLNIKFKYLTNTEWTKEYHGLFLDYEVVKIFEKMFGFKADYNVGNNWRWNKKFLTNEFSQHRSFSGDVMSQTLTGHFGGEVFGGWAVGHLNNTLFKELDDKESILLRGSAKDFFSDTIPSKAIFKQYSQSLNYRSPFFLAASSLCYSSQLYFRNNQKFWMEPYLLANRKISPFLADSFLYVLDRENLESIAADYALFSQFYRSQLNEYIEIPFNSDIAKALGPPACSANSVFNISIDNQHCFDHVHFYSTNEEVLLRMDLLISWLKTCGFSSSFANPIVELQRIIQKEATQS